MNISHWLLAPICGAAIFLSCSSSETKQPSVSAGKAANLRLEEERYDFGKIAQGTVVEHVFKFTNVGYDTLVVDRVESTCGCTVAILSSRHIAPGESGEIKVSFDSHGKVGPVSKPVMIYSNGANTIHQLDIYGEIEVTKEGR